MLLRGLGLLGGTYASTPATTTITTPGTGTQAVPNGAVTVAIECYGSGSGSIVNQAGGGGGGYSKKNAYTIGAVTQFYYEVGAGGAAGGTFGQASLVRDTNAGGTLRCEAKGGGVTFNYNGAVAASGTGDIKYGGGLGGYGGGGGGGTTGDGGDYSGATGGTAGGGLAGAGGNGQLGSGAVQPGNAAGGGGGRSSDNQAEGARGAIVFTWTY